MIVWIHGGSFYYGSGAEYGPSYLLDEKVVLVTLNYRLGILGNGRNKTSIFSRKCERFKQASSARPLKFFFHT